jgi:hypothetical protein
MISSTFGELDIRMKASCGFLAQRLILMVRLHHPLLQDELGAAAPRVPSP